MSIIELEKIFKTLNLKELKKAKKLIDAQYKKRKKEMSSQKLIDTYKNQYGVYFRLERVFCNKSNCSKCNDKNQEGHGPYWYSYKNGKREYIGKKRKEELDEIKKFNKLISKNKDNRLPYKG